MADIQPQFEQFNDTIRLGRFEENQTLREKRDIIRKLLRERLPGVFATYNEPCPDFDFLDQGSYEMDTGTKPLDGDYDIDQGLYFKVSTAAYPDPIVLKERVHEALDGHTDDVCIRRSCVTVFYHCDGERIYHVDVAVYSDAGSNADGKSYLAKGKQHSTSKNRFWQVSDPQSLADIIRKRWEGDDRKQFRRLVRIEKRWRGVNFSPDGNGAPNGIGLTVATLNHFWPTFADPITKTKRDDLNALLTVVNGMLAGFRDVHDANEGKEVRRLVVELPVEPWTDLFSKMTSTQMANFEAELKRLKEALEYAAGVKDPVAACERLQTVFGDEFPVPKKQETATSHPRAIASSGNSA